MCWRRPRSPRPRTCGGEVMAVAVPPASTEKKNNVKDWVGGGGGRRYQSVLFIITTVAVGIYNAFFFRGRRHSRSPRRSSVVANVGHRQTVTATACRVVGRR